MSGDAHSPFVSRAARGVLTARFAVLVDVDGRVLDAHVTLPSGREPEHLILDGALVEALRRFHFLPAHAAGQAQRGWSVVECALRLGPAGVVRHDLPDDGRRPGQPDARQADARRGQGSGTGFAAALQNTSAKPVGFAP